MKIRLKLYAFFIGVIILASCKKGEPTFSAETMLNDSLKRQEIMQTISGDAQLKREMMTKMLQTGDTIMYNRFMYGMMGNKMWMQRDTVMGKIMMENILHVMENDSTMCNRMYKIMLDNPHMRGMMGNKMTMGRQGNMGICPMHGNRKMGNKIE